MSRTALCAACAVLLALTLAPSTAWAEPMFLARQYTRCTACHYSPSGGGLLTPYGRQLSHRELSTTGASGTAPAPGADEDPRGEQAFLIDAIGAVQKSGWTAYATAGREPPESAVRNGRTQPDAAFISYEHWLGYQAHGGFGIRLGRFMPAYGVRFSDHTAYTRTNLDFDRNDQVYGVELSATRGASLLQVTLSPGKAEAIVHDTARRGFSMAGRWQRDLTPRAAIVGSAIYRDATDLEPKSGAAGGALGFAPTPRISVWTEVDASLQAEARGGHSWVAVNET